MRRLVAVLGALALTISACTAGASPEAPGGAAAPTREAAVTALAPTAATASEAPIDSTLAAESRIALSAGAKEALAACGLLDSLDLVSGMAELPHAADAPTYANIWGSPPIPMDEPAWLITTKEEIFLRTATDIDPTCIVIDGEATWLSTGGSIENGEVVPPLVTNAPKLRLPPLGP